VTEGSSYVDESMLNRRAGSRSRSGPATRSWAGRAISRARFRFRATKVGADTALARIVALVRDAQSSKAPAQRLADLAGKYLVIVALASGVVTLLVWLCLDTKASRSPCRLRWRPS